MHMVDPATTFATQMWPPFNQMMTAQEAKVKDHAWYCLCHQPKSHPYYKVMEELTRPLSRAKHQAQLVDKGKGKELGTDEAQRIWLLDTMARTTGVATQKLGNEEDQNREKAQGCSQSRCGQPVAKPVNASDQTSRGWSWSRRPTKKAKPAVNKDVQDWQDINNPPESWEVVLEAECASWQGMLEMPLYQILMQLVQGEGRQVQDAAKSLPFKASLATIPRRHSQPSHHFNAGCASSIDQLTSQTSKGTKLKSIHWSIQSNKPSFVSWPMDWPPQSIATDPPITPVPITTTGANDPCHCDEYQEEVTVLKQENADMRWEIEVTHTELAALHQVVDAFCNHLFLALDVLNHPLVPFHTTSNPTLVPHMPVMVELGTATSVVEVQSSQSSSRQESTEPPPKLHLREVLAWKYLLQMLNLCMDLLEVWQSLLLHHHQQSDAAIYSILSKCDLQEEVATAAGSCYCMIQILENQSGMVIMMVTLMSSGHYQSHHCGNTCISSMVLVPVHAYTVDLLLGGQAGQAWHGIISGQASMALAPGWHSWHWCWDSLTDGLTALGMCQNIWHRCQDGFHGISPGLVLAWLTLHWCWDTLNGIGIGSAHVEFNARTASMALLTWHSSQDGLHGIGDGLAHMAVLPGWLAWHWCWAGLHDSVARGELRG
ncbi:hypothetical protein F5J12DRAFT_783783 [Pisolithus orientalis]|uniref:uncharacterized protein n=1 Tax=Pisolithus orientalis TaxID=936130 RepID=UPI0022246B0F|nr:uncharacterized protein F5J12DRAFT_783783 [Pisolithus orientalis]KAI6002610.1 hypothetical protein F5J12DRAFT_783783 [Pisolithus orientalis]